MSEFQKMILAFCFIVSIFTLILLYVLKEYGFSFEVCNNKCKIYNVGVIKR